MKKTYHLCWSGNEEILFRSRRDYIHGIICLFIAAHETESTLLAYCLMSNHIHICIRTEQKKHFIKAFRYSYTRYFNSRYQRRGKLGEPRFFSIEIKGLHHILAAISYILRNPVHHGVCSTPFAYEFSSARAMFNHELGFTLRARPASKKKHHNQIPDRHKIPSHVRMDDEGLIMPDSIVDTADLEHQFSSVRAFLYYMNRVSGEEWEKEQFEDKGGTPPITLEDIEHGVRGTNLRDMLANMSGRTNLRGIGDIELCEIIDNEIIKRYGDETIYTLHHDKLLDMAESLQLKYRISKERVSRCLALPSRATHAL